MVDDGNYQDLCRLTMTDIIAALRAFNRFHTRFSGVLQPSYMDSGLGVTAARLLYEIAQDGHEGEAGVLAAHLQDRLGLDAGHASRLLRGFEKRGWIVRARGVDARQRPISLTKDGRAFFALLDARTRADMEVRIAGLGEAGREELGAALLRVRHLLGDAIERPDWHVRTFRTGDLALIASRQAILYDRDYGWGRAMEVLQAEIVSTFLRDFKPGREQCWVAEADGQMLGAVLVVDAGDEVAQLRLLHVEPEARGLGIGAFLVDRCLVFASDAGYARMTLWTQDILTAARRIYERAGFERVSTEVHDHFGMPLTGERWDRLLP